MAPPSGVMNDGDRQTAAAGATSYGNVAPHPAADANRAAQLNIEYQRRLVEWKAMPVWRRLFTSRPEPPTGI